VVEAARVAWAELVADPWVRQAPSWRDDDSFRRRLRRMLDRANEEVCRRVAAAYPALPDDARIMSSTAVAVLINGRRAIVANLGDSRVYLVRDELVDQVTVDTNRRTTVLRRERSLDGVANASGLSELTGNVGRYARGADGIVPVPLTPEFHVLSLLPGDRLLVCSDGVPDCIGPDAEATIHRIVRSGNRPSQVAWELVVAANQTGGEDNITAVVVDCVGKEEAPWPAS
jgi:serine/threonine protein phosphatase PrpC